MYNNMVTKHFITMKSINNIYLKHSFEIHFARDTPTKLAINYLWKHKKFTPSISRLEFTNTDSFQH